MDRTKVLKEESARMATGREVWGEEEVAGGSGTSGVTEEAQRGREGIRRARRGRRIRCGRGGGGWGELRGVKVYWVN